MSRAPNNPFQPQPQPDTYAQNQQPKQAGNSCLWVFAIVGVLAVVGGLVCCGGGYFLFNAATDLVAEAAAQELKKNPVVKEHIGNIESLEINLRESAKQNQETEGVVFVFDIKGDKGSGKIVVVPGENENEFESINLVMDDGTTHEIPVESFDFGKDRDDIEPDSETETDPSTTEQPESSPDDATNNAVEPDASNESSNESASGAGFNPLDTIESTAVE